MNRTQALYKGAMKATARQYLLHVGFTEEELNNNCDDTADLWILYKNVSDDLGFKLEDLL